MMSDIKEYSKCEDSVMLRAATLHDVPFVARCVVEALHKSADEVNLSQVEALCRHSETLYSYRNAVVACVGDSVVGCLVFYDGARYAAMRRVTFDMVWEMMGLDFRDMPDEAQPGELYLDSLFVDVRYRGYRLGEQLFAYAYARASQWHCPKACLVVEQGFDYLEQYYASMGFNVESEGEYFGVAMRKMSRVIL